MFDTAAARAATRELAALAISGLDPCDVQEQAVEVVGRLVPYDATCWATVDPRTMLLTGSLTVDFNPSSQQEAVFAEIESGPTEANTFAELSKRPVPVGRLSDLPYGLAMDSRRLHELYRPMGIAHEIRAAFLTDGMCWGVAGLLRGTDSPDFDENEMKFLAAVSPLIAGALRSAARSSAPHRGAGPGGPVVILVGPDGAFRPATSAARDWLDASDADRPGQLGMALQSVAAAVSQSPSGTAQARMRDASGAWVTLRAAPLIDKESPRRVLVTVEPAPEDDVVTLMLHAYSLTMREQQICREVLAGHGTGDIAERLHLSVYTVQDHLKSVFAKVGVRSRRELTGVLRGRPALRAMSSPPANPA